MFPTVSTLSPGTVTTRKYLAFGVGVTAGAVDVRDGGGACEVGATDELGSTTTFVGSTTGMARRKESNLFKSQASKLLHVSPYFHNPLRNLA